jgi:hypothetical protein
MGPARQADTDPYAITLPIGEETLLMNAVEDIGKCACAIFQDESNIGKTIEVHSDKMPVKEIAEVFSKVCGQSVQYNAVPTEVYASFGFPAADDLANMFRIFAENATAFLEARVIPDNVMTKMGSVTSLEKWVTANKETFILEPMVQK